jgi:hypothetical protein
LIERHHRMDEAHTAIARTCRSPKPCGDQRLSIRQSVISQSNSRRFARTRVFADSNAFIVGECVALRTEYTGRALNGVNAIPRTLAAMCQFRRISSQLSDRRVNPSAREAVFGAATIVGDSQPAPGDDLRLNAAFAAGAIFGRDSGGGGPGPRAGASIFFGVCFFDFAASAARARRPNARFRSDRRCASAAHRASSAS